MDIPGTDGVDGITDRITDFQSWPTEVWGFLAILILLVGGFWIWQNMGGKLQIAVVVGLLIAVLAAYMT